MEKNLQNSLLLWHTSNATMRSHPDVIVTPIVLPDSLVPSHRKLHPAKHRLYLHNVYQPHCEKIDLHAKSQMKSLKSTLNAQSSHTVVYYSRTAIH